MTEHLVPYLVAYLLLLITACIPTVTVVVLARRVRRLSDTLDRVRLAAYDLSTMASDEIKDLQQSLDDAGVTRSTTHAHERMLDRLDPSRVERRFEETVARIHQEHP